jgi:SAM-dependent methyltransferase
VGFAADWLALREPADRAARDDALARRAAAAAGPAPLVVDLGCGTGAAVRALAPYLPTGTRWRLVDNDPHLLAAAVASAGEAADAVEADLADLSSLPLARATLVTASALLDLVSRAWLEALADRLTVPLYASLSYSGSMRWSPADPQDEAITASFNRHQRGDKGLGPALGPDAAESAAAIFEAAGFSVQCASSPWRLGPAMAPLQRELTAGIAAAAGEAGVAGAAAWGRRRCEAADETVCEIGHVDLLAIPRSASGEASLARR